MAGLLIVGIVIVALALYGLDRAIKARAQVRRLRTMTDRLDAATVRAERHQEKRQAAEQASAALTSVMPAIERPPLTLADTPSREAAARAAQTPPSTASDAATGAGANPAPGTGSDPAPGTGADPAPGTGADATTGTAADPAPSTTAPHSAIRPKTGREHTGPQARRSAHPGRRPSHVNKHVGTLRAVPDGEDHNEDRHTRVMPASADTD